MMGTRGLLNFHLSVGSYLGYYPGGLTGSLPTDQLRVRTDVYMFLFNLTKPPTFSQPMNDTHAEKAAALCYSNRLEALQNSKIPQNA